MPIYDEQCFLMWCHLSIKQYWHIVTCFLDKGWYSAFQSNLLLQKGALNQYHVMLLRKSTDSGYSSLRLHHGFDPSIARRQSLLEVSQKRFSCGACSLPTKNRHILCRAKSRFRDTSGTCCDCVWWTHKHWPWLAPGNTHKIWKPKKELKDNSEPAIQRCPCCTKSATLSLKFILKPPYTSQYF